MLVNSSKLKVSISNMNNILDWNDYRVVLLIAEAGSLSKAAKMAGSSHPTLFRKINAVEKKLGVRLFDRFQTGYQPTATGEEVIAVARQIADLTTDTERRVAGRDLRPSGTVRIATTDTLLFGLVAPLIEPFRQVEPDITLEIIAANEISDLSYREADIAIRPAAAPDQHLVGRKLGVIHQAIYASQGLVQKGLDPKNLKILPWVGPSRGMPYPELHSWMKDNRYNDACVCRMNTVLGMYSAVQSGVGVAVLPMYLAEAEPALMRIGEPIGPVSVDLWLLTHPDLRHTARVRAVLDYIAKSDFHLTGSQHLE